MSKKDRKKIGMWCVILLCFCLVGAKDDFDIVEELLKTDPAKAESICTALLAVQPKNLLALIGQGHARLRLKKYYECQDSMQK